MRERHPCPERVDSLLESAIALQLHVVRIGNLLRDETQRLNNNHDNAQ